MERAAFELSKHLSAITEVKLLKWGGSNKWLPFILPYLFCRGLWALLTNKIQVIYLQDGLLAPLGLIFKLFTGKPVIITVHGRDITYDNALYQFIVPRCLKRLDRVICVSEATKQRCLKHGATLNKIAVIPNGISDDRFMEDQQRKIKDNLSIELGLNLENKIIILSVGRLVERKGIHWFVEKAVPKLTKFDDNYIYLIAGDGNYSNHVKDAIKTYRMNQYVYMLGGVTDELLRLLYNAADIFIMPNILVEGDMEGFGLVALEAASCRLPVVASNLEGIRDAIKDGKNGFRVKPGNPQAFIDKISELLGDDEARRTFGERARQYTLENYGWDRMAREYLVEFNNLTNNSVARK